MTSDLVTGLMLADAAVAPPVHQDCQKLQATIAEQAARLDALTFELDYANLCLTGYRDQVVRLQQENSHLRRQNWKREFRLLAQST